MLEPTPEQMSNPTPDGQDERQPQPVRSRREYWQWITEQSKKAEEVTPPDEGAAPPQDVAAQAEAPAEADSPQDVAAQAEVPAEVASPTGDAAPPQEPPQPPDHPAWPRRPLRLPRLHFGSPFWTIASIFSLTVNLILILVLILLAREIFGIKNALQNQLINGLYNNFTLMDQASIKTTIPIHTSVPAKFDLPLNTVTTVVLQKDVLMKNAKVVSLTTGGLTITNAPADIVLPMGTSLPVSLNLTVPVDQQIPVNLNVVVDIPLNQTELHAPFVGLQNVVNPYKLLLDGTPNTLRDAVCGQNGSDFCKWIIP